MPEQTAPGVPGSDPAAYERQLELAAIDDAYQEQLRSEFGTLIDNLIVKDSEAGAKFFTGLGYIRDARCLAIQSVNT